MYYCIWKCVLVFKYNLLVLGDIFLISLHSPYCNHKFLSSRSDVFPLYFNVLNLTPLPNPRVYILCLPIIFIEEIMMSSSSVELKIFDFDEFMNYATLKYNKPKDVWISDSKHPYNYGECVLPFSHHYHYLCLLISSFV